MFFHLDPRYTFLPFLRAHLYFWYWDTCPWSSTTPMCIHGGLTVSAGFWPCLLLLWFRPLWSPNCQRKGGLSGRSVVLVHDMWCENYESLNILIYLYCLGKLCCCRQHTLTILIPSPSASRKAPSLQMTCQSWRRKVSVWYCMSRMMEKMSMFNEMSVPKKKLLLSYIHTYIYV